MRNGLSPVGSSEGRGAAALAAGLTDSAAAGGSAPPVPLIADGRPLALSTTPESPEPVPGFGKPWNLRGSGSSTPPAREPGGNGDALGSPGRKASKSMVGMPLLAGA